MTMLSLWKGEVAPPPPVITMASIAAEVTEKHGFTLAMLRSPYQYRTIAHARQEAMARMVEAGRWSTTQIGRFLNWDHTTVIYGARAHRQREAAVV